MKNTSFIYLLASLPLLLGGCLDHSDEVDYRQYNVLTVSDDKAGDEADKTITIDRFMHLQLSPTVVQSMAPDETNLKFSWKIRGNDTPQADYDYHELASTHDLDVTMTEPVGKHRLIYTVTDTLTGVSRFLYYNINVTGDFSVGWTILEETPQGGDISMITPMGRVFRNIYFNENHEHLQDPVGLFIVNDYVNFMKVFVLLKHDAYELSREEFTRLVGIRDWFVDGEVPDTLNISLMDHNGNWISLVNNGQYHVLYRGGFPGDPAFSGVIPGPEDDDGTRKDYYLAPFYASTRITTSRSPRSLLFDSLNRRFVYGCVDSATPTLSLYDYKESDAFNPSDLQMDLRHISLGNRSYYYNAVCQDDDGVVWLLVCNANGYPRQSFAVSKAALPAVLKGFSAAASSTSLQHMFFAVENKIYHYDIPAASLTSNYSFPQGEEVTHMFTSLDKGVETLGVVTYDGSEGRVYFFTLEPTGKMPSACKEKYEGFGKIVDIKYKSS